ncbi:MAG: hypothetical protein KY447_03885 [Actinobacteria bacterium]|nr:hypothetical protein [Actinomycetota bacterium]MBW3642033.1 hypothetical protein [Actinomycetota bacterium]
MTLDAHDLSYRARALAQTHPLTPLAKRFIDRAVGEQRTSQPLPEIGIWAGAALIVGYCLRRVEEDDAGLVLQAVPGAGYDLDALDAEVTDIAANVRTDAAGDYLLGDEDRTVAALDRLVHSEVDKRLEHWRDSVDDKAWAELEEYLTWWVVKGYALRVGERRLGLVEAFGQAAAS